MVQGIIFKNKDVILTSGIEKNIPDDYNDPDLDIKDPYLVQVVKITGSLTIKPFLSDYTEQTVFSFRSDDILTMFTPKSNLVEEYKKALGVEEQLELDITDDVEE